MKTAYQDTPAKAAQPGAYPLRRTHREGYCPERGAAFHRENTHLLWRPVCQMLWQKLGCSTQPVLYHFKTIEDVRIAAHKKASEFHIDYVTNLSGKYERPMLEVGMRYLYRHRKAKQHSVT